MGDGEAGGMRRIGTRALPAFGCALLATALATVAFLPWATWLGAGRQVDGMLLQTAMRDWLLWGGMLLGLAWVANIALSDRLDAAIESRLAALVRVSGRTHAVCLALTAATIAALISVVAFTRNPHIPDTMAQLFQARIFAQGHPSAPAPDRIEFFIGQFLLEHDGRWFSQYPPGHSMLLALGLLVGLPWLVNPLALAGTVPLVYGIARRLLGEPTGRLATVLYTFSPFVLLMSGSYMNHVTAGFFLALALYAVVRVVGDRAAGRWVAAAGFALGVGAATRPLEAVAWAAVLAAWLTVRRGWKWALTLGGTCAAAVAPLLAYNAHTTGHALRFGYTLLWGGGHGLGFHPDPWGEPFTPVRALGNTVLDFQRLNVDLFGWPLPSLLFILVALAMGIRDERVRKIAGILSALLVAAPVAYFFYWHHDSYLGPRFLYASVIPAVLLTAAGIAALDRRLSTWRPAVRTVVAAAVLYALAVTLPRNAGVVAGMTPEFRLHPEAEAKRAGIDEAVVFVKVGWESRLVGRLRGWQVPAAEVERSLQSVDGCRLQHALDEADSAAALGRDPVLAGEELRQQLSYWRLAHLPVCPGRLPDPKVSLDTTQALSERCLVEARWDQSGFIRYEPFVWRNDPWLRRGVIYARYLGSKLDDRLMADFPGRKAYLFAPASNAPGAAPVLIPMAVPSARGRIEPGRSDLRDGG